MSKESHSTSSGSPAPSTHSTQSTATFRSRASSLFSINSTFGRKAKGAAEPPSTTKSRSINQGIAAILVEGSLPPAHHIHGDTGDDDDNKSLSSRRVRKRDKFLGRFWSPSPEPKIRQSQTPSPKASVNHRISPASTQFNDDSENEVSSTEVTLREIYAQSSAPPTKPHSDDFLQNVDKPAVFISLPRLGDRIETTPDLALRFGLLPIVSEAMEQQEHPMQAFSCDTAAQHLWVKAMKQDPSEQDRLRQLGTRMVDEFAKDASKDSTEIAEMVLLGPVLENEHYRRLLSCMIAAFDHAILLDVDLLQGLVQLVQSAPSGSLLPDDLVKILRVLRIRLQDTHQQSSVHPFYLTLAVSRLLDVMAEHKVHNLDRVEEHEPLYGVLSGLRGSSDPYLMYQACYAFQALQYVPNDESPLQAVLRHGTEVVGGLVKITAVLKLDLAAVIEGLDKLYNILVSTVEGAGGVYEGARSVLESGQGVLDSLKEGLGSGQKRLWYMAIRTAQALVYAGQLKDFNILIYKAPCRRDPLFQWGICQLLGEIASDAIWDTNIRQKAVDLLGDLYKNDLQWGQDESVKDFMLNIIHQLSMISDKAISTSAHTLLKDLKQGDGITTTRLPYPLMNRLPLPTLSPILSRVLAIPDVEQHILQHKAMILQQAQQDIFIPPLAKPGLKAKDGELFPLLEKVLKFLASEQQVMLVLGDSGSGKSTFNRHLERRLWADYKRGEPIPLFINLPAIDRPVKELMSEQLKENGFSETQVQELKHRRFVVICDGYDESQLSTNLHSTNLFNRPGQWKVKMVITCRTQYLGLGYRDRFMPQGGGHYGRPAPDLFEEAVIVPFSKEQIERYVEQYVLLKPRPWVAKDYMDRLTAIPNLLDLVRNPFLLSLALEVLPGVTQGRQELSAIKITRVQLYDTFVNHWLRVNQRRLESNNALSKEDRDTLEHLINDNFIRCGIEYLKRLSAAIFKEQDGNPVVQYVHRQDKNSWKGEFFGSDPEAKLLCHSSPLTRTGTQYRFVHRTVLEYFLSCVIYNPVKSEKEFDSPIDTASSAFLSKDFNSPLFKKNLLDEPSIIQFLSDRVSMNPEFEQHLRAVIDQSKTDPSVTVAATNAITILINSNVSFHGADLRGIKVPGADLSYGQFDSAQFQGADLSRVNLSRSWLRQADMTGARLEDVRFGELPYLEMGGQVHACTYSPDGKLLAAAVSGGEGAGIGIYDTSSWTRINSFTKADSVLDVAFSPDGERVVSAGQDPIVRLWNRNNSQDVFAMKGHEDLVRSVDFSPRGEQIASSSDDGTVRLWDSRTGESLFVLEGHACRVTRVKYSPSGDRLVSGGSDGVVRLWDSATGKAKAVLRSARGEVLCLAYSPNGQWVVSGHADGALQIWNTLTGTSGPVLQGHTNAVKEVKFSQNGKRIASTGVDETVRLWDVSTGALLSKLSDHSTTVDCAAFSPDGSLMASGGDDEKVHLRETNLSASRFLVQRYLGPVWRVAYSPDGRTILSVSGHTDIRQWDSLTGAPGSLSFEFPGSPSVRFIALSPNCQQVAAAAADGSIRLWSLHTGATGGLVLRGHTAPLRSLAFLSCGRQIVSSDMDETVWLWDLDNPDQHHVASYLRRGSLLTVSPDGLKVACPSGAAICLFDRQSGDILASLNMKDRFLLTLVFSPTGQQLAIGTGDENTVKLWNLHPGQPAISLEGHTKRVNCIAYSPCGQWIASGSDDKSVRLWRRQQPNETESWSCVSIVRGFFAFVCDIAWNPTGPMEFVTACWDGSVRVWRVSTCKGGGVVVRQLWGPNFRILCVADMILKDVIGLSPTNKTLLIQRGAVYSRSTPTMMDSEK